MRIERSDTVTIDAYLLYMQKIPPCLHNNRVGIERKSASLNEL